MTATAGTDTTDRTANLVEPESALRPGETFLAGMEAGFTHKPHLATSRPMPYTEQLGT